MHMESIKMTVGHLMEISLVEKICLINQIYHSSQKMEKNFILMIA